MAFNFNNTVKGGVVGLAALAAPALPSKYQLTPFANPDRRWSEFAPANINAPTTTVFPHNPD